MAFNPNMIGTQTTSIKPKIVQWSAYSEALALQALNAATVISGSSTGGGGSQSLTTAGVANGADSVVEGEWAWAAFQFVDPSALATAVEMKDSATLNVNMTGASASDYENNGQVYVFGLDASGAVVGPATWTGSVYQPGVQLSLPVGTTTKTSSTINLVDDGTNPVTNGTGVYGLLVATKIKSDTVIETGDRVLFQVTNNDSTKFTDSAYVEKYVDIVDAYTAESRPKIVVAGEYTVPGITTTNSNNRGITNAVTSQLSDSGVTRSTNIAAATADAPTVIASPVGNAGNLTDSVKEGQWAIGKFSFVSTNTTTNHTGADVKALQYATDLKVAYTGASTSDYSSGSFKVYATDATGNVWKTGSTFVGDGSGTALIVTNGKVTLPAGSTDVILAVRTAQDTLVESGEEVIFQIGKVDVNSFSESDYVEKKVQISDYVNTYSTAFTSSVETVTGSSTVDEFVIATASSNGGVPDSFVSSGSVNSYDTIVGFGTGDYLKIDIKQITGVSGSYTYSDVSNPNLSLVNFGTLNLTEDNLIIGLRQLNGVESNVGGVYVMGAKDNTTATTTHTFILIDSNNDGKLTTNAGPDSDVFVKLAGILPSSIESTDFMLV